MSGGDDIPYQDIVDRLSKQAESIAQACIPDGRREGIYWRGDLHGKISVHVRGGRIGMVGFWQNQGGNAKGGGNLVHLIELAYGCKTHGEAVRLAKERFLGISKRELTPEEKRQWAKSQDDSRRKAEQRQRQDDRDRVKKETTVRSIWRDAKPIAGTLAEEYLRSRSIELSDFPEGSVWMPSLRFHPALTFGDEEHPALIGGVRGVDRRLVAIWRIFLGSDGRALVDGDGKKVKLGLGPASGGAVRFGPPTGTLRLAEGMETALGVMLLTRCTTSVWATLSTSGMVGLQIPEGVSRVEIYADGDRFRLNQRTGQASDPPGIAAAKRLRERLLSEGVDTVIFPSPEPDDWLDVWVQRKRDEQRQRTVQYL